MKTQIFSNSATIDLFNSIDDPQLLPMKQELIKDKFSDGEFCMRFPQSIRANDIFIMGDTSQNLTELLFSIDAARRASAKSISVVLPYYGYGRQDRKGSDRVSIGAKVMAKVLEDFKIDRLVTIDFHSSQIESFFNIPVDHIKGYTIFLETLREKITTKEGWKKQVTICSPDEGGNKRAKAFASRLNLPMVTISKNRDKPNSIESMELMGNVEDREVWIVDDMVDTCGTLCKAATYLKQMGAEKVSAIATHGVLSGKAVENVNCSDLTELIISDTVKVKTDIPKIKVVSCIKVLQKAIVAIINEESLQPLTY